MVVYEQVGRWRYTGYYGCPERSRREESWDMIRELAGKSTLTWCILSEYNDMIHVTERCGRRAHPIYFY